MIEKGYDIKELKGKEHGRKNIVVCVPTKDEEENVEEICEKILKIGNSRILKEYNLKILFINDHSTDSTPKIERALERRHRKKVFVIDNDREAGLGNAYISGFDFAIKRLRADIIVSMDADLSHNPAYLPKIISELGNADLVLGSRYVKGGMMIGWPLKRKIISRIANLISYASVRFKVKDVTSGFRAYRRNALKKINYKSGRGCRGYAFQMKLICEALKQKLLIKEVPIVFRNRRFGKSKLRTRDICEFFLLAMCEMCKRKV